LLEITNLSKHFGKVVAVDDITFSVPPGEIFGLLGANGAGKTTTLRTLSTMLAPTSGEATVCRCDLARQPAEVRTHVGIMFGGETGLYDRLTARENILYFANLGDVTDDTANARIEEYAAAFSFSEYLDTWCGKLSKGTRQKVAFCRSIVHNPEVMLFDEPFLGLDVTSHKEAEDFVLGCRAQGKAIIFSDHTLPTVEKLCDRIGILVKGKLMAVGTVAQLTEQHACATLEDVFFKLAGKDGAA